jgi:hypothetical protein
MWAQQPDVPQHQRAHCTHTLPHQRRDHPRVSAADACCYPAHRHRLASLCRRRRRPLCLAASRPRAPWCRTTDSHPCRACTSWDACDSPTPVPCVFRTPCSSGTGDRSRELSSTVTTLHGVVGGCLLPCDGRGDAGDTQPHHPTRLQQTDGRTAAYALRTTPIIFLTRTQADGGPRREP